MPQDREAAAQAFYDHEIDEQPRTGGRRRRPAADWGVGEDIFDRMPSPRFGRRGDQHDEEPREERDDRTHPHSSGEPGRFAKRERQVETWDDDAAAAWGGEEAPTSRTIVIETTREDEVAPQLATDGRRTIVISGHPDRLPAPRAQRPAMTAVERIGARPDRIVGYSVALGFLLILIAILTT
jgi:hypothetical protein